MGHVEAANLACVNEKRSATRRVFRAAHPLLRLQPLGVLAALTLMATSLGGCTSRGYYPDRATAPYPYHLHTPESIDVQVFRDGTNMELVNGTGRAFADFDLWVNQRWVRRVESLPAGGRLRLSLWDFYDERGETMEAGGMWRTRGETPLRLVQIQLDDHTPLIGLVTVRDEPLEP